MAGVVSTTGAWKRFLSYAAHARTKPSFDAEERDYRLGIAERAKGFLRALEAGGKLEPLLGTVFEGQFATFRSYQLTAPRQDEWLNHWASLDAPSLRAALLGFLDEDKDAEARFETFASMADQAAASVGIAPNQRHVVTFGSLFNFAVEPAALPAMRPGQYERLERRLGCEQAEGAGALERYRHHLAFASDVRTRLEAEGVPLRDMVDVQSLIWEAAEYEDLWTAQQRLGPPGRRRGRSKRSSKGLSAERKENEVYLSVCAMYRNEAEFLPEWIEFHRLMGVERFFLYDNLSSDSHLEVLAPYVEDGTVVLYHWRMPAAGQNSAYDHCLRQHGKESRWIAFIDLDEFLFSPTERALPELLREYEGWPGVAVHQAQYGFSGHRTKPEGRVIENYVQHADLWRATVLKSIVDPEGTLRCLSPHHFEYKEGSVAVDENGHPARHHKTLSNSASRLRVNHYYTKSEEEFRRKSATPDAARSMFRIWPDWDGLRWTFSQITDPRLSKYGPAVSEAIAEAASRTLRTPVAVAVGTIEAPPPPSPAASPPAEAAAGSGALAPPPPQAVAPPPPRARPPASPRAPAKGAWKRFVSYAAHARTKPSFDAEERAYRLDIAERLNGLVRALEAGCKLVPALDTVFDGYFSVRPYEFTTETQNEWLSQWASLDEPSLRAALLGFLDEDKDADARFWNFTSMAEHAAASAGIAPSQRHVVTFGSLFNFAVAPAALPAMQPGQYEQLERRLGRELVEGSDALEQYRHHLAFASDVRTRLEAEGVPIRDMLDVQGLIGGAADHEDLWTAQQRLGQPGRRNSKGRGAERRETEVYLSVCAMYRDQAEFLPEWIEFHRLMGVERFFLYDNLSSDSHLEALAPYVEDGTVVLYHWRIPGAGQNSAYDHCLRRHGKESRWIAFIDLDEFLFSPTERPLPVLLEEYEGWPGVAVHEAHYGFSGHRTKPEGRVIENYVERVALKQTSVIKTIVDPEGAIRCLSQHHFEYKEGSVAVDENGHPARDHKTLSNSASRLRVNHYYTKSEEEFRRECATPDAASSRFQPWPDWGSVRWTFSQVTDPRLSKYGPAVSDAIAETARRTLRSPVALAAGTIEPPPAASPVPPPAAPRAPAQVITLPEGLATQATWFESMALRSHLGLLLPRLGINCVLDVGAFDGEYGRFVRAAGYTGWIVSMEPVSSAYDQLEQAAKPDARWRTLRVALGRHDESRQIKVAQNSVLSSFLEPSAYAVRELGAMTDTVVQESVTVRSLDSVIEECLEGIPQPRIFLKTDTQGWDLEVMHGAQATLPRVLGVQTELAVKPIYDGVPDYSETMDYLQDQGFEVTGMFGVVRDHSLRLIEFDCVMARAEHTAL